MPSSSAPIDFGDGEGAAGERGQDAAGVRRDQHAMDHAGPLLDGAEHIAGLDALARLARGDELPARLGVERVGLRAGGDEISGRLGDAGERAADPVEHRTEETGPQLRGQRLAHRLHRLAHRQPGGVLVDLKGGQVAALPDHLAEHLALSDQEQLVERCAQRRGLHQRAGDAADLGRGGHCSLTR